MSDHPWEREAHRWGGKGRSAAAGASWRSAPSRPIMQHAVPLLLLTLIAVLYPLEYDTGRTNYSLGDALVGPVALVFILGSLSRRVRWPRYMVQVIALVLVAIASTLVNAFSPAIFFSAPSSLLEITKLCSAALWMCVIFWLLSEDFSRRFLQLACCSILFATVFAVASLWVTVRETTDYRPTGPFDNDNLYASYLCFNVFLVLATREVFDDLRRSGRRPLRWLSPLLGPVMLPLLLMGILATASRGALVGCLAGFLCSRTWRPRRIPQRRLVAIATGLALLLVMGAWYIQQHPLVLRRLQSTAEGSGPNIENRLELWHAGRDAFFSSPVVGVGYGQLRNYIELATGDNKPVHETFISMGAELGVAGLLVFVWLLVAVLRDTVPARSRSHPDVVRACRGFVIAVITQGLFTNVQHSRALWITIGVLAVLAAQQRRAGVVSPERASINPRGPLWKLSGS